MLIILIRFRSHIVSAASSSRGNQKGLLNLSARELMSCLIKRALLMNWKQTYQDPPPNPLDLLDTQVEI